MLLHILKNKYKNRHERRILVIVFLINTENYLTMKFV